MTPNDPFSQIDVDAFTSASRPSMGPAKGCGDAMNHRLDDGA